MSRMISVKFHCGRSDKNGEMASNSVFTLLSTLRSLCWFVVLKDKEFQCLGKPEAKNTIMPVLRISSSGDHKINVLLVSTP